MTSRSSVNNRYVSIKADSGASKITLLVFSILFGALVYAGYVILPFYYYYFEMCNQMESVIRVASTDTDQEIRQKLVYHVRKMDLPVGDDDDLREALRIDRESGVMRISLPYEEVFSVYWQGKEYVLWRFKFKASAEGHYK